jgi:hypothetical protein
MPRLAVIAVSYVSILPSYNVPRATSSPSSSALALEANYSLLDTQVISKTRKLTFVNLLPQLFLQIGRT